MIRFILICVFLLLFFIISIPLYLVVLVIGLFSKEARAKASQAIACAGFRGVLLISGTRVVVSGLENVPKDTPVLYVANHRSYYDIVTCYPLSKNNTAFLSKKEMLKFPFVNIWMLLMNCQFLDRNDLKKGLKTILKCAELLKGNTSVFVFPEGTRGCNIDAIARYPLWQTYRNFGHGTGHGVGFFLNVHEGPQAIRQDLKDQALLPGMVTSNEPGIYRENSHGIRHENMLLCVSATSNEFGRWYKFETLTLCYFDTSALCLRMWTSGSGSCRQRNPIRSGLSG